jgi:UDP-3-O-[3-hydroxymyristoyl] N-acetylglucosamine deacetylase
LDNTVVMDDFRVLNRDGLRWSDEFVRHKALDLIGDLALLGIPLEGHVVVERGGHALHQRLVRALLAQPSHWTIESQPPRTKRAANARPGDASGASGGERGRSCLAVT